MPTKTPKLNEAIARLRAAGAIDDRPFEVRKRAAIHEAGHAVAVVALGYRLDHVNITPQTGRGGIAVFPAPGSDHEILIYLAGPFAESCAFPQIEAYRWRSDFQNTSDRLVELHANTQRPTIAIAKYLHQVRALLLPRWQTVEHIADLLLTHNELYHADIAYRLAQAA